MSKTISIILLEDIAKLGKAGQIVQANEGYARNLLFPQGQAALANAEIKAKQQTRQQTLQRAAAKELASLQKQASKIDGKDFTIMAQVKAGEGDELYAGINADLIVNALKEQANINLKPKQINITDKLTCLGTYPVSINLSAEVEAVINLTIISADSSSTP